MRKAFVTAIHLIGGAMGLYIGYVQSNFDVVFCVTIGSYGFGKGLRLLGGASDDS